MRKITKNTLIHIGSIIVFIVIMYLANRLLCLKTMHGSSQCISMYAQPRNSVDVVMLGTSHMHCDVDPAVLWTEQGIASYVFSAAEQPMWLTYYYLLEFCKYQSPKVVLIDLYAPARNGDSFDIMWIGENLYNIRFSLNKIKMIATTCDYEEIEKYFPSFFGYHSRYEDLDEKDFAMLIPSGKEADYKGFSTFYEIAEGQRPTLGVEDKGNIEPKSEMYLKKIIEYTKENDMELFLIVNPYPTTADDEIIYNRIRELAEDEGIPFKNTNYHAEEIGLDHDKDYSDESHLNHLGSRKYSSYLAKLLKSMYEIPDRRGVPDYDSWDRNANP